MNNASFEEKIWQMVTDTHMHDESELKNYNKLLYHYTTCAGLIGIIQTNKIWATSALFLNDSQEIKYGINLTKSLLIEVQNESINDIETYLVSNLLAEFDKYPRHNDMLNTYISCFSEQGDKLSQWKGFTEKGLGFSIGFDSSQFIYNYRSYPYVFITVKKVIYDPETQKNIIKNEIGKYIKIASDVGIDLLSDSDSSKDVISCLSYSLFSFARIFKDEAFAEEREWRAISTDLSKLKESKKLDLPVIRYRTDGNIIPYVEFDISPKHSNRKSIKMPINEIICGPKIDFERNSLSIKKLLEDNDFYDVLIKPSNINLR